MSIHDALPALATSAKKYLRLAPVALGSALVAIACTSSSLTSTNPTPTKCTVKMTPETMNVGATGGTVRLDLAAEQECDWTATSEVPWISGLTPAAGQGNSQITMQVTANPQAIVRRGNVTAGGVASVITQDAAPCTYSLSPTSRTVGSGGGNTTVDVATLTGCSWTASSDSSWLRITANGNGNGSGTITLNASANSGTQRSATVTVAGQTMSVTQEGAIPSNCTFTATPSSVDAAAAGGPGTIGITTQAGCQWTATASAPWITIADESKSGSGNASVAYSIASNTTGSPRNATIVIGSVTIPVTQAAATSCSYALSSPSQTVGALGGAGTPFNLTTAATCTWTASSNASWIVLASPASGSGNAVVTFTVAPNLGAQRTGTISIGGQTHTVVQNAVVAPQCSYNIAPMSQNVAATAATGLTVAVTASSGCAWTAVSHDNWISVTSGASGSGNGTVTFSVTANSGAARAGTMTIAGATATVNQAAPCSYSLTPDTRSVNRNNGSGSFTVTAGGGCSWTAQSNASWISITSATTGSGNGSVNYSYERNNTGSDRQGTITVNGVPFTLSQNN